MERLKFTKADWPLFKREAIFATAALGLAVALIGGASHWAKRTETHLALAKNNLTTAQNDLANVENERSELLASIQPYRELVQRSIIGDEERLNWRDTLVTEKNKNKIEKLTYNLAARQPFTVDAAGNAVAEGMFKRYRATMQLNMEFQREMAFVDFLDGVSKTAHAITIVRNCEIQRKKEPDEVGEGKLAAECVIDWATLEREKPQNGIGG